MLHYVTYDIIECTILIIVEAILFFFNYYIFILYILTITLPSNQSK